MGIIESSTKVLMKIAFRFEFFYPQAINFFLNRKLKEYKNKGQISDYKVKTRRRGKYHYFLEMDLFVDKNSGGERNTWRQKRTRENNNRCWNKRTINGNVKRKHDKHASYNAASNGSAKKRIKLHFFNVINIGLPNFLFLLIYIDLTKGL